MTALLLEDFRGERPILADGVLANNESTFARDVKIQGKRLTCLLDPLSIVAKAISGTLKSFYQYSTGDWFEWASDVDVVTTQTGNDAYDRRIFTGDTNPKVTYNSIATSGAGPYPATAHLLGCPPPGYDVSSHPAGVALCVVVTGTATDPTDLAETRFYVATSVDVFGGESAPCPISNSVTWQPGQTVTVTFPSTPSGNYNIVGWNLYRTSTGTSGTDFQYVQSGSSWGAGVGDSVATSALGEALGTENYDLPNANMIGITAMPGGFLAGHYKNQLFFSEPGHPHAWPVDYQLNTKADIVGIKTLGQNMLVVTTKDKPYMVVGNDPSSMSITELGDVVQACVNKRSMCDVGAGVIYASPDGLVLVTTGGANVITTGVFTRSQWQALKPESMECYYWEGLCMVFWNTGTVRGGFIINPNMAEGGVVTLTDEIDGGWYDSLTDKLYLSIGGYIKQWDAGTAYRTGYWFSKKFEFFRPTPFGAARLRMNTSGAVTILVYDDNGNQVWQKIVYDTRPTRVPGGKRFTGASFALVLTGAKEVHAVELAESMSELRGG